MSSFICVLGNEFVCFLFVLVLDLSIPEKALFVLNEIHKSFDEMFKEFSEDILNDNILTKQKLIKNKNDVKYTGIKPWNLIIVGSKYDVFEKMDV